MFVNWKHYFFLAATLLVNEQKKSVGKMLKFEFQQIVNLRSLGEIGLGGKHIWTVVKGNCMCKIYVYKLGVEKLYL